MKTQIWDMPVIKVIDYRYSKLIERFSFYSKTLDELCVIPAGFVMDWESMWVFKGTSKVSGIVHDFLSREDSIPIVTKKKAAKVYLEFLKYRGTPYMIRYIKYWAVRMATGYFHKHSVFGTYEELIK